MNVKSVSSQTVSLVSPCSVDFGQPNTKTNYDYDEKTFLSVSFSFPILLFVDIMSSSCVFCSQFGYSCNYRTFGYEGSWQILFVVVRFRLIREINTVCGGIMVCEFCPKCGRLAEYDPYYNRTYCTCCEWRSEFKRKDTTYKTHIVRPAKARPVLADNKIWLVEAN